VYWPPLAGAVIFAASRAAQNAVYDTFWLSEQSEVWKYTALTFENFLMNDYCSEIRKIYPDLTMQESIVSVDAE
jgi:hypothetical protein